MKIIAAVFVTCIAWMWWAVAESEYATAWNYLFNFAATAFLCHVFWRIKAAKI